MANDDGQAAGEQSLQVPTVSTADLSHIAASPRTGRGAGSATQAAHMELTGLLAALINSGELAPGVRLPPERDMCKQFGGSRTTVRHVLDRLERQNLITRHVGRGTFVAEPKTVHTMSVPESMVTAAEEASTYREVYRDLHVPNDRMRELMTVEEDEEVSRTARVRFVGGRSVSVEVVHLPTAVAGAVDDTLLATGPLGVALAGAGVEVARARQRYDPVLSAPWESDLLDVPPGTPLMLVTRRSWDHEDRVVEYTLEYHRADRNSFLIEVTALQGPGRSAGDANLDARGVERGP